MKNILKISILSFVLMTLGSCTNDKDPVASVNGFELRKDASVVLQTVFSEAIKTDTIIKLNWDRSNNGVASSATYTVYIADHDADPNFQNGVESSVGLDLTPDARKAYVTVDNLNVMMNQLSSFNCGVMNIDIRIKSKLGISTNALYQYSNPITVNVTGYPKNQLLIAFSKDSNYNNAAKIKSSGFQSTTDYEGFMYLETGNYKFYKADACGDFGAPVDFGISGGNAGTLVQGGATAYTVTTAGHYFVNVNMDSGTYSITPFNTPTASFGIFGNATGIIGFGNTKVMNYSPETKKWTITIELTDGKKFGFKTGNGGSPAAILAGSGTGSEMLSPLTVTTTIDNIGTIKAPGDFVNDATKTKYDVEVDLNNPRAYTYKMKVNPN